MISSKQIQYLENIFNYYNEKLFENKLPEVVLSFSRDPKMSGMFLPGKWGNENKTVHELVINSDFFKPTEMEFHQMIVHEMCHLFQFEFGTPGKRGYHNLEFQEIMNRVGLQTSDSGTPEGFKTGYKMADYPIESGSFLQAFQNISNVYPVDFSIEPKTEIKPKTNQGSRTKYSCSCSNIWGKDNLQVSCNSCKQSFVKVKGYDY